MILLRHAQSEFNVLFANSRRDPGIIDPPLTEKGHQQVRSIAATLSERPIRRILTSPYTRALQTALPLAQELGVPVEVRVEVRERFVFSCDIGRPASVLSRAWPTLDFSGIDEVWWPTEPEPEETTQRRAFDFCSKIAAEPSDAGATLVVTHWAFIRALTGVRVGNGEWLALDPLQPVQQPYESAQGTN